MIKLMSESNRRQDLTVPNLTADADSSASRSRFSAREPRKFSPTASHDVFGNLASALQPVVHTPRQVDRWFVYAPAAQSYGTSWPSGLLGVIQWQGSLSFVELQPVERTSC